MIWISLVCVWVLVILGVVVNGRAHRLAKDLEWWRNEAIRLNNEKHRKK